MRRIGGLMDYSRLLPAQSAAALSHDLQAHHHFRAMPHDQQVQAIRRLAAAGQGDHTIARATGLSVEMVRRVLAEQLREAPSA